MCLSHHAVCLPHHAVSVSSWFVSHVICRPVSYLFYYKHQINEDILFQVFRNTELTFVLHLSWSNIQPSFAGQSLRKIYKKKLFSEKEG